MVLWILPAIGASSQNANEEGSGSFAVKHCKELETVATEVEKLVNSRLQTYQGGDYEPSECPLTPTMLFGDVWGACPYVLTDGKEKMPQPDLST